MYKLVTYVPELQEERILAALKDAGAGQIVHYSGCAFLRQGSEDSVLTGKRSLSAEKEGRKIQNGKCA